MSYHIYIIQSQKNNRFYIGQTNNIKDRIRRHNNGENLATKSGVSWKLIYSEDFNSRSDAVKREKYLKSLKNKKYLKNLLNIAG